MFRTIKPAEFVVPRMPKTQSLDFAASSNDPSQRVWAANTMGRLAGTASNQGIVASTLTLSVDGHTVQVSLSAGQSPEDTVKKLGEALPARYSVLTLKNKPAGLVFLIQKQTTTVNADEALRRSQSRSSPAGKKLDVSELMAVTNAFIEDGMDDDARFELARMYALSTPTEESRARYLDLQAKYRLPEVDLSEDA
jgi:hypothetical protein